MGIKASFQADNPAKFILLFGILTYACCSILLIYFLINLPQNMITLIVGLIILIWSLVIGYKLFFKGYDKWVEYYEYEVKLLKERIITEVLKQDMGFINLQIKEIEYNTKAEEFNKNHKGMMPQRTHREFYSIVEQAMDIWHYEDTFPKIFQKIQQKNKKVNNGWFAKLKKKHKK